MIPNTSLVWGEVSYNYKPAIGYVLTGTLNLKDQIYMRPRLSDTITRHRVVTSSSADFRRLTGSAAASST